MCNARITLHAQANPSALPASTSLGQCASRIYRSPEHRIANTQNVIAACGYNCARNADRHIAHAL